MHEKVQAMPHIRFRPIAAGHNCILSAPDLVATELLGFRNERQLMILVAGPYRGGTNDDPGPDPAQRRGDGETWRCRSFRRGHPAGAGRVVRSAAAEASRLDEDRRCRVSTRSSIRSRAS
jgi:hypothetical protein